MRKGENVLVTQPNEVQEFRIYSQNVHFISRKFPQRKNGYQNEFNGIL